MVSYTQKHDLYQAWLADDSMTCSFEDWLRQKYPAKLSAWGEELLAFLSDDEPASPSSVKLDRLLLLCSN